MKISDIKNIYEENITFDISDKPTYMRVVKLLMKNGFRWTCTVDESIYSDYFKNDHIIIHCNQNGYKYLSYNNRKCDDDNITIDEYNFNSLYLYFNPIPDYKPKKFIREI